MAKSRVEGVRETVRSIRRMTNMQRPISEASRYALMPMLAAAKSNLRVHKSYRYEPGPNVVTGKLLKGMAIRKDKSSRTIQRHVVAATGKAIRIAHLVEFGTDPHWQPRRMRMHPGAKPFPFLTPAFHRHDDEAVSRFGQRIVLALESHARRVAAS